ncbi:hypothetical protein C8R45DRAFT_944681 [Mycena sanguinolenta]|nr:hypothetical protein C8R45DRAFT_944681 [Mycena sanguinolenta]
MSAERFGIAKSQWQVGGGGGGQLLLDSFENPVRVWEGEVGAWKKIGFDGTRGFGGDALVRQWATLTGFIRESRKSMGGENPVRVWEGKVGAGKEIGFDGTRGFGGGALRIPCAYRLGNYIGDIKEAVVRECETDVTGGKPRWAYGATSCSRWVVVPDGKANGGRNDVRMMGQAGLQGDVKSFPRLTHLGFMEETKHECVVRAANSKPTLTVLVRGPRLSPIHDRVVYLLYSSLTPCSDWLKRASPAWNPNGGEEPVWDQWMFADHVMAQRKHVACNTLYDWVEKQAGQQQNNAPVVSGKPFHNFGSSHSLWVAQFTCKKNATSRLEREAEITDQHIN